MARRKIVTLALAMVMLLSLFAPASAAARTISYGVCEFYVTVDGETASFIYTLVG